MTKIKKKPKKKKTVIKQKTVNGKVIRINFTALENKMESKRCAHQSWNWQYKFNQGKAPKGVRICDEVGNKLILAFESGIDVDKKYISKYINYIFGTSISNWMLRRSCCKNNYSNLSQIVQKILKYYVPTNTILKKISFYDSSEYFKHLKGLEENSNFNGFDEKFALTALKKLGAHCNDANCNHDKYFNFLFKHSKLTKDIVDFMFSCRCNHMIDKCTELLDSNNELISINSLHSACNILPKSKSIVEALHKMGYKIDAKCLEIVCKYCDEESIKYVLDYNIPVQRVHFRNVVESKKYTYSRYTKAFSYKKGGYTEAKAELLFKSGYRMNKEDIIFSIEKKIFIPGIDRFGITLDNSIYQICHENKFYPEYNFELENRKMLELQKLCNGRSLKKIQKYITDNEIKPDQKCILNACSISYNYEIICFLIDQGCTMNIECFRTFLEKNIMKGGYRNYKKIINKIIDNFEETINNKINGSKENHSSYFDPNVEIFSEESDDVIIVEGEKKLVKDKNSSGLIEIDGFEDEEIEEIVKETTRSIKNK